MKVLLKGLSKAVLGVAFAMSLTSCGLMQDLGVTPQDPDDKPTDYNKAVGNGDIQMAGTLALAQTSLRLTADTYDLYCVTFDEEPNACKIDIASNAFDGTCKDFAGAAFGCFVRKDKKTVGTIEFEENTSMVAGAGDLVFDIAFDPSTGVAVAKIDKEKSSALSEKAMSRINKALDKLKTKVPNLTGVWALKCVNEDEFGCSDDDEGISEEGMEIFMHHFGKGDKQMVEIWQSEERKKQCVGEDELNPNFTVKVGGKSVDFKFGNMKEFGTSVTEIYKNLPGALKDKIYSEAKSRIGRDFGWCTDQTEASDIFSQCKFVAVDLVEETIWDQGEEKVVKHPKWYDVSEYDSLTEFTGTAQTEKVKCSVEFKEGVPQCPPEAGESASEFKVFKSGEKPIFLVCMDHSGGFLHQFPAKAATKSQAIAIEKSGEQGGNNDCDVVKDGTFKGELVALKNEVRRTVSELLSRASDDHFEGECSGDMPSDFTFDMCEHGDEDIPQLCHETHWMRDELGMKVSGGKWVASGEPHTLHWDFANVACPDMINGEFGDELAVAKACRDEFVKLSVKDQVGTLSSMFDRHRPIAEKLICSDSDDVKGTIEDIAKSSCAPEMFIEDICGENGCRPELRCPGSMADGRCLTEDGKFVGRLPGRMALMRLKPRLAGMFEMTERSANRWSQWDEEMNEPIECKNVHMVSINARLIDEGAWEGIFTSGEKSGCGEETEASESFQETFKMQAKKL